jgi:hypothetical protein
MARRSRTEAELEYDREAVQELSSRSSHPLVFHERRPRTTPAAGIPVVAEIRVPELSQEESELMLYQIRHVVESHREFADALRRNMWWTGRAGTLTCYRPKGEFFFEQLQLLVRGFVDERVPRCYPAVPNAYLPPKERGQEQLWSEFYRNLLEQIDVADKRFVYPAHVVHLIAKHTEGLTACLAEKNTFFLPGRNLLEIKYAWRKWHIVSRPASYPKDASNLWLFGPA